MCGRYAHIGGSKGHRIFAAALEFELQALFVLLRPLELTIGFLRSADPATWLRED